MFSLCSGPPGTWTDHHDWPLLPPLPLGTLCSLRNIQADVSCGKYSIGPLSVIWVSGRSIKGLRLDPDGDPRRYIVLLRDLWLDYKFLYFFKAISLYYQHVNPLFQ